ncbi:MAG: hypothetical protein JO352_39095 [Chloroflexi bacterium]|nr:hypothetical protein [Chloroflexota bacterium]
MLGVAAEAAGLAAAEGEPLGAGLAAADGEPLGAGLLGGVVAAAGDGAALLAAPAAVGCAAGAAGGAPLHAEPTSAIAHATNTRLNTSIDHLTCHRPSISTWDGRPMVPIRYVPLPLTGQYTPMY